VSSLFTSIPRGEFSVFVDSKLSDVKDEIFDYLASSSFGFDGKLWRWTDGLDMGSHLSPCLARAYLCWKESFVLWKGVQGKRYVDDVIIRGKVGDDAEDLKARYEACVSPLKMEWSNESGIMDAKVSSKEGGGLRFNARGKRFPDLSREMPRAIKAGIVAQTVKRINERSALLTDKVLLRAPSFAVNALVEYVKTSEAIVDVFKPFRRYTQKDVLWSAEGTVGVKTRGNLLAIRHMLMGVDEVVVGDKEEVRVVELTWCPWFDSDEGIRVIDEFMEMLSQRNNCRVCPRWKMRSMKSSSVCMWKLPTWIAHAKSKVTDEDYRGIVETGV
jgi:hypothetical protein